MAIPFKTLSFNPNDSDWGINFERTIQRKGETLGWVSRNRQMNPGVAGKATGFAGLEQGAGLDVVPSMSVRRSKVYVTGDTTTDTEPSLDVFYKVTPSLNAALTINTDFSSTEIDDRQVNLTRLSMPNSVGWRGGFSSRQVEQNFYPAVGFIDRIGIRDQALDFGRLWRFVGKPLRSFYTGLDNYRVTKLDTGHEAVRHRQPRHDSR
jgi:hypothetical protein